MRVGSSRWSKNGFAQASSTFLRALAYANTPRAKQHAHNIVFEQSRAKRQLARAIQDVRDDLSARGVASNHTNHTRSGCARIVRSTCEPACQISAPSIELPMHALFLIAIILMSWLLHCVSKYMPSVTDRLWRAGPWGSRTSELLTTRALHAQTMLLFPRRALPPQHSRVWSIPQRRRQRRLFARSARSVNGVCFGADAFRRRNRKTVASRADQRNCVIACGEMFWALGCLTATKAWTCISGGVCLRRAAAPLLRTRTWVGLEHILTPIGGAIFVEVAEHVLARIAPFRYNQRRLPSLVELSVQSDCQQTVNEDISRSVFAGKLRMHDFNLLWDELITTKCKTNSLT